MTRWAALAIAAWCCASAGASEYVSLPGGRFESVLPQGPVPTVSTPVDVKPFRMRNVPVTVAEFEAFVAAHPEWRRGNAPSLYADARYLIDWTTSTVAGASRLPASPVINVSWFAATAYCESEDARLPSWIEWEYAAAADESRTDARADPAWRRRILAWYERPGTAPLDAVGGTPNVYGVSDLHGLVWEWVEDFNAMFIAGDSRTQGDPDVLKFCGSGALNIIDRLRRADAHCVVVIAQRRRHDKHARLPLREAGLNLHMNRMITTRRAALRALAAAA